MASKEQGALFDDAIDAALEGKLDWLLEMLHRKGLRRESEQRINQARVAELFDVSQNAIVKWAVNGCPHKKDRKKNSKWFDLGSVIRWREEWWRERLKAKPETETLRSQLQAELVKEKLMAARRRNEREANRLHYRYEVMELFVALGVILQGAGETLGREFGTGAQEVLTEAIQDYQRRIGQFETKKGAYSLPADAVRGRSD